MPYLIDSDVLIDISRGNDGARNYVNALPQGWAISQISALELLVGARNNRELAEIDKFLSAYVIVPLRAAIGATSYELLKTYSRSHSLHVFDSLIASTAIEEALTLVTKNRKHFSMIKDLLLQVPEY